MMVLVLRAFPDHGIVALFDEAPGGGDIQDIEADCNRPANAPADWLDNIKFHSDMNYMEVVAEDTTVKSHGGASPGSPGSSGSTSTIEANNGFGYQATIEDFAICTHDLGYVPYAAVVVDGTMLFPGMPVQIGTGGAARYATAYCTTTEVRVESWCSVGGTALDAADITYQAIVFRAPRTKSGSTLFEFDPSTGIAKMGLSKFQSDRKYLQVVDDSTPFGILLGRGGDVNNGAVRLAKSDGTTYDPVPDTTKLRAGPSPISAFGDAMIYGGSFSAPDIVEVQVPDDPTGGNSGFSFDPDTGVLAFEYDGRTTLTGAGKMIGLLPEIEIDAQAVDFPDLTKNKNYWWRWQSTGFAPGPYSWFSQGQELVAAPPQEWSDTSVLMTVPDGADFLIGRARLNRVTAPANNWLFGDPLDVGPVEDEWMPFMGALTVFVEQAYGLTRMFHVYIDGSDLKLLRQQSVSNAPGGYGTWDNGFGAGGGVGGALAGSGVGTAGIVVKTGTGKYTADSSPNIFGVNVNLHKWDGGDPDSVADDTDFASEYELDLRFSFGRVS